MRTWARDAARGAGVYDFGATVGEGKGDTHPVHSVSWYDVVKWCNAKSERAGLTPVYYTNDAQTAGYVYRTGNVVRLGADIGLVCRTCNRRVLLPRRQFERGLKAFVERAPEAAASPLAAE